MSIVKVMADYHSYPLWRKDESGTDNVDPSSLPISAELAQKLMDWAEEYDATLNQADPLNSGFPDATAESAFHQRGSRLARQLAAELPADYTVEFFDGNGIMPIP